MTEQRHDAPQDGYAALAHILATQQAARADFRAAPGEWLERHGVPAADLPALGALLDLEATGRPMAERRALKALVFIALASSRDVT